MSFIPPEIVSKIMLYNSSFIADELRQYNEKYYKPIIKKNRLRNDIKNRFFIFRNSDYLSFPDFLMHEGVINVPEDLKGIVTVVTRR
jgi:hypothetical protein